MKESVIYQVLTDRFSRGRSEDSAPWPSSSPHYAGGTLQGLTERLDYVGRLGADWIWITPVNESSAYHGYHPTNYYGIDSHFGTIDDMLDFTKEARKHGIRVMMDYVANHVSKQHPFFIEAKANPQSPYRDWFHFNDDGSYACFLNFTDTPKLNLDNPQAREHVIGGAAFWLEQGVSGFRLDHVIGPKNDFWKDFRAAVRKSNPKTVLIGEVCAHGDDWNHIDTFGISNKEKYRDMCMQQDPIPHMMHEYVGILDGALDFGFKNTMQEFARGASEEWSEQRLREHYTQYPKGFHLPSFLDSHDMPRYLFTAGQNKERLKQAIDIQLRQPQPAVIYYGTETGMTQHRGFGPEPHSDLQAREGMQWDAIDEELLEHVQQRIHERRGALSAAA